jgi:hypothetical protein
MRSWAIILKDHDRTMKKGGMKAFPNHSASKFDREFLHGGAFPDAGPLRWKEKRAGWRSIGFGRCSKLARVS